MSARPLVSVITPTWQRPELLRGAIADVRAQTYRPLEHVIVIDGQDLDSATICDLAEQDCDDRFQVEGYWEVTYAELGRNWSSYLPASFCAAPVTVGMLLARGEYQTWLADDERMGLGHITLLVDALEAAGADFAYSRVRMYRNGQNPEHGYEIGTPTPECGQITNALYRADLLKRGLFPFGDGMTSDWACIQRWIAAGATWAYVPRVTLTHRIDH